MKRFSVYHGVYQGTAGGGDKLETTSLNAKKGDPLVLSS